MKDDELICKLLTSTNRSGMDTVLRNLRDIGFFQAPASAVNHLNCDGGLALHSLNVCKVAMKIREQMAEARPEIAGRLGRDSVVIAALLHDICKSDIYRKARKFRKNGQGRWEDYEGYETDYSNMPVGHGEKSVIMLLRWGLELTEDEILAIRWHMSAWDMAFQSYEIKSSITAAANKCPLLAVIQAADVLASHVLERE